MTKNEQVERLATGEEIQKFVEKLSEILDEASNGLHLPRWVIQFRVYISIRC
jgi:hypothetical protein